MIIRCIAHSMFLIQLDNGFRILTDPVDSGSYPVSPVRADAVLISHHHHDHDALENAAGYSQVIDTAGEHTLAEDISVTAVPAWHDDARGKKRGPTLLFLIRAEGLRLVHLGDLGHLPQEEQIRTLAPADVLMTPVGGYFTIDAGQAKKAAGLLQAHTVLPMHYRTEHTASWPIGEVGAFTGLYPKEQVYTMPLVRVTAGDLCCQPGVIVLEPCLKDPE